MTNLYTNNEFEANIRTDLVENDDNIEEENTKWIHTLEKQFYLSKKMIKVLFEELLFKTLRKDQERKYIADKLSIGALKDYPRIVELLIRMDRARQGYTQKRSFLVEIFEDYDSRLEKETIINTDSYSTVMMKQQEEHSQSLKYYSTPKEWAHYLVTKRNLILNKSKSFEADREDFFGFQSNIKTKGRDAQTFTDEFIGKKDCSIETKLLFGSEFKLHLSQADNIADSQDSFLEQVKQIAQLKQDLLYEKSRIQSIVNIYLKT